KDERQGAGRRARQTSAQQGARRQSQQSSPTSAPPSAKRLSQQSRLPASPMTLCADVLANEQAPLEFRFQAAKELALYAHSRLASDKTHKNRLEELRKLLDEDD